MANGDIRVTIEEGGQLKELLLPADGSGSNKEALLRTFLNAGTGVGSLSISREGSVTGSHSVNIGPNAVVGNRSVKLGGGEYGGVAGYNSVAFGDNAMSGDYGMVSGYGCEVTADYGSGAGSFAISEVRTKQAFATGLFSGSQRGQRFSLFLRAETTSGETRFLGLPPSPSGVGSAQNLIGGFQPRMSFWFVRVTGVSQSGEACHYLRQLVVRQTGEAQTIVGSIATVGTDLETDAGFDLEFPTNEEYIGMRVTGLSGDPVRWIATIDGTEIGMANWPGEGEESEEDE